jgi:hypothetical protein
VGGDPSLLQEDIMSFGTFTVDGMEMQADPQMGQPLVYLNGALQREGVDYVLEGVGNAIRFLKSLGINSKVIVVDGASRFYFVKA